MRYAELRELERLLGTYIATRPGESVTLDRAFQVRLMVSREAGRVQHNERRPCAWCGREHSDRHPSLCDACVNRKGVPVE